MKLVNSDRHHLQASRQSQDIVLVFNLHRLITKRYIYNTACICYRLRLMHLLMGDQVNSRVAHALEPSDVSSPRQGQKLVSSSTALSQIFSAFCNSIGFSVTPRTSIIPVYSSTNCANSSVVQFDMKAAIGLC